MRIYQKEGVIDMATRTLTQSNLNNNMSGNTANALYYATHGGTGNAPVVTGKNNSGNYTTSSGGTTTYHFAGPISDSVSTGGSSNGGDNGSGNGSGSSSGSGSGSYSGSYDTSAYGYSGGGGYGLDLDSLLARQEAAARDAYNNSMARVAEAYNNSLGRLNTAWANNQNMLASNRDATLQKLQDQYDYSEGKAQNDANKSLREAYINYMMNKKNLAQGLSAMGMSGGATESSMAKLFNNYGSSRNNINTTLADNLAALLNELSNNKANANQLYNSQAADAMNQYASQLNALEANRNNQVNALEANLASALANVTTGSNMAGYANYLGALQNIQPYYSTASFNNGNYAQNLANINNTYEPIPTQNTLATNLVNTTANNNMGSVTDYAKWKAMADSLSGQGANTSNIIYQLRQNGAPLDAVYQILGA